jgi:hypothetical protein
MAINQINDTTKPATVTDALKRRLIIISVLFATIYAVIAAIPALTITPVDWFLERLRGVTFVSGWTPGTMVYSVLLALIPLVYIIIVTVLLLVNRRNRISE